MGRERQTGWRFGWAVAAALALVALTAGPAAASAQDVVKDYQANGAITGNGYTVGELQDSKRLFIALLPPGQIPPIFDQVDRKIAAIWGRKPDGGSQPAAAPSVPGAGAPTWLAAVAAAALLLAFGGIGSSVYRRTRRPQT